jgi:DNA-binding CsgD family transcriptional regulator
VLEILVVPACFVGAGLLGHRLGTPPRVVGGLIAVGCSHLLAFLGAGLALRTSGATADLLHLASQWMFLGGFVGLVWLAATYPANRPSTKLMVAAGALGLAGPLLAALSSSTPALLDDNRDLGPVLQVLPNTLANVAAAPLPLLPLLAVITFVVRHRRAGEDDRAAMRWPMAGLGLIAALALAGTLVGPEHQGAVTALFLVGAPAFPLAIAFGPVARHLETLAAELAEAREGLVRRMRPEVPPGVLARLSPRELKVLEAMAEGRSNPVIARTMHLSLSSVEKHATSIFRKLEIAEGPDVHRRVAAVVAFRDALDEARGQR